MFFGVLSPKRLPFVRVPVKDVGCTAMLQPMSHFTALQDQSDNHLICSTKAAYIWR